MGRMRLLDWSSRARCELVKDSPRRIGADSSNFVREHVSSWRVPEENTDARNGHSSLKGEMILYTPRIASDRRNKYRWNKEVYGKDYICSIDRKPDPRVEVCL